MDESEYLLRQTNLVRHWANMVIAYECHLLRDDLDRTTVAALEAECEELLATLSLWRSREATEQWSEAADREWLV